MQIKTPQIADGFDSFLASVHNCGLPVLAVLLFGAPLPAAESTLFNVEQVKATAEKGAGWAQSELGWRFWYGHGVKQDFAMAIKWASLGAEQGEVDAQALLSRMYRRGQGMRKPDNVAAAKWALQAAEQGDAEAQNTLGEYYRYGYESKLQRSPEEAVKWWRKAAAQGYASAQNQLGKAYGEGAGVPKDEAEREKWMRLAAEQEFGPALARFGSMLRYGGPRPTNRKAVVPIGEEALSWYCRAGAAGDRPTQQMLGRAYAEGNELPKNPVEAYFWLKLAGADAPSGKGTAETRSAEQRDLQRFRDLEKVVTAEQQADVLRRVEDHRTKIRQAEIAALEKRLARIRARAQTR